MKIKWVKLSAKVEYFIRDKLQYHIESYWKLAGGTISCCAGILFLLWEITFIPVIMVGIKTGPPLESLDAVSVMYAAHPLIQLLLLVAGALAVASWGIGMILQSFENSDFCDNPELEERIREVEIEETVTNWAEILEVLLPQSKNA